MNARSGLHAILVDKRVVLGARDLALLELLEHALVLLQLGEQRPLVLIVARAVVQLALALRLLARLPKKKEEEEEKKREEEKKKRKKKKEKKKKEGRKEGRMNEQPNE